jgi:hypothetical protein
MGKKKKEHRKKVAKRNELINAQKRKMQKMQEEFIKALIEKEKQAGKFENNEMAPKIDTNLGEGLQI